MSAPLVAVDPTVSFNSGPIPHHALIVAAFLFGIIACTSTFCATELTDILRRARAVRAAARRIGRRAGWATVAYVAGYDVAGGVPSERGSTPPAPVPSRQVAGTGTPQIVLITTSPHRRYRSIRAAFARPGADRKAA